MTRKLLALSGRTSAAKLVPYHDHNGATMRPKLLADIGAGKIVALVSDAGTPLISDPGYKLVAACHDNGLRWQPFPDLVRRLLRSPYLACRATNSSLPAFCHQPRGRAKLQSEISKTFQ